MIRAVLFDLDGTLFDRDRAIASLAKSQYSRFRNDLTSVSESSFVARLIELDDHGHGDKPTVYRTLATELSLPRRMATRLESDFWFGYHEDCAAYPGVDQALRSPSSARATRRNRYERTSRDADANDRCDRHPSPAGRLRDF